MPAGSGQKRQCDAARRNVVWIRRYAAAGPAVSCRFGGDNPRTGRISGRSIYDGEAAGKLAGKVLKEYIPEFQKLRAQILLRYKDILETL